MENCYHKNAGGVLWFLCWYGLHPADIEGSNAMKRLSTKFAAAVPFAMSSASPAFAQTADSGRQFYHHGSRMMWGGGPWGGHGMLIGPLFSLLVLIAIIALVIHLLRTFGFAPNLHHAQRPANNALDILKERYARGEIDSKEFDERRRMLSD
jgi:putative membrane protein